MDCELIREGLSAFLDDEDAGISKTELDAHVSGCVGCSAWWARASELHRSVRVRPAEQVPDLSAAIVAAAAPAARRRSRLRSEEHTSELQSLMRTSYAVFCLKKTTTNHTNVLH